MSECGMEGESGGLVVFLGGKILQGERFGLDSLNVKRFIPSLIEFLGNTPSSREAGDPEQPLVLLFDKFGGDEKKILDFLFNEMKNAFKWAERSNPFMKYRGNEIARTKAFFCKRKEGDLTPADENPANLYYYYYTGVQWGSILLQHYIDSNLYLYALHYCMEKYLSYIYGVEIDDVKKDKKLAQEKGKIKLTQIIATLYESGQDCIGAHSDKTKSIRKDTPIFDISLGGVREFHITQEETIEDGKEKRPRSKLVKVIIMEAGDLFILGPLDNNEKIGKYKHEIVPVSREKYIDRTKFPLSARMSLVARDIKICYTREQVIKKVALSEKSAKKRNEINQIKKRKREQDKEEEESSINNSSSDSDGRSTRKSKKKSK